MTLIMKEPKKKLLKKKSVPAAKRKNLSGPKNREKSVTPAEGTRLNKFIADSGTASRRKVDEMISEGRITVNGKTVLGPGMRIDPGKDKVQVDGEPVRNSAKKVYYILNKPKGIITSVSDEKNRTTVIDLIKPAERIFPVGRLDYDSSGLLLLTNDGELANRLMHPSGEVRKSYLVRLSKPLEEKHRLKIQGGVVLEGRKTAECEIVFPRKNDHQTALITIHEGRNRQIRNMFEKYGYFVRELDRVEYAGIKAESLKRGGWRKLQPNEVNRLYRIAGLKTAG